MATMVKKSSRNVVIKNTFIEIVPGSSQSLSDEYDFVRKLASMPARSLQRRGMFSGSSIGSSMGSSDDEIKSDASTVTPQNLGLPDGIQDEADAEAEAETGETRTTVMLRSLPEGYSRIMLEELLDREGFLQRYDFMYVPADIASGDTFFYAFINLVTPQDAVRFRRHFTGFDRWPKPSHKVAEVDWSEALQGLVALVERYRNSPLMHSSVPGHLRPALYHKGECLEFPEPTITIKAPRLRRDGWKRSTDAGAA